MNQHRNPHFSGETDRFVWFNGTTSITVVEMADMKMREIKGFLPTLAPGKEPCPFRVLMKDQGTTIVVTFILELSMAIAYMNRNMKEPEIEIMSLILPNCKLG